MTTPNDTSEDFIGTNDEWSGVATEYPAGMSWAGSMFPSAPRDPMYYGLQNPLELVPAPGPYDIENGDEAWRRTHHGTQVYTGEGFVKALRSPTAEDSAHRKQFWDNLEAQQGQSATATEQWHEQGQYQNQPAAGGELRFPDALPVRSQATSTLTTQHPFSVSMPSSPPVFGLHSPPAPGSISAQVPTAHHSSSVDGEYELDDEYFPDASQQLEPTKDSSKDQFPDGTPPKTLSPRGVDDWDDANLLSLWKHKVIRKKGYEPMLTVFTDQTVESLHETWTKYRKRCQQLGAAWEAAGKPRGPLSEWFEE